MQLVIWEVGAVRKEVCFAAVDPREQSRLIRHVARAGADDVTDISRHRDITRGTAEYRPDGARVTPGSRLKWHRGLELCISNNFAKLSHPVYRGTDDYRARPSRALV